MIFLFFLDILMIFLGFYCFLMVFDNFHDFIDIFLNFTAFACFSVIASVVLFYRFAIMSCVFLVFPAFSRRAFKEIAKKAARAFVASP